MKQSPSSLLKDDEKAKPPLVISSSLLSIAVLLPAAFSIFHERKPEAAYTWHHK
jgi:hypothetical protein